MPRYIVFIIYRREGGAETARLLRIALNQQGYRVFPDVDHLSSGHFDERDRVASISPDYSDMSWKRSQ